MATPKTSTGIPVCAIAAEIDELGALEQRLLPFRADLARVELLRKAVRAHCAAFEPADASELRGVKFFAMVGPRANERKIDFKKLAKLIGVKVFAAFATCTLAQLEEYAPGMEHSVVTIGNTGARSIKTFERSAA
ncbi:MAG: hypothetical protein M3N13_02875 [Candidatus Eremiobacteraeota bacterium]|nr:hypothetical protein [Candidatus Eremiobacteraeota bacterium]